jgi:hypothetical protein
VCDAAPFLVEESMRSPLALVSSRHPARAHVDVFTRAERTPERRKLA